MSLVIQQLLFARKQQYLLDTIGTNNISVYSLDKLNRFYDGPAIRVRRNSDNSEIDIGFENNSINTQLLTSFVGAGTGFVTTFYNQTNANHLIQTIAVEQPTIVRSGVIDAKNNKPSIHQSPLQHLTISAPTILSGFNWSINYVATQDGTNNGRILSSKFISVSNDNWLLGWWNNNERAVFFNGTGVFNPAIAVTATTQSYTAIGRGSSNLATLYRNSVDFTTAGSAMTMPPTQTLCTNGYADGTNTPREGSDCHFHELIVANYQLSDVDRLFIEASQKARYQIT